MPGRTQGCIAIAQVLHWLRKLGIACDLTWLKWSISSSLKIARTFTKILLSATEFLKLDSEEKIEMPNVVRTVTRSTMVSRYLMFCEEENFEPLSHSTLFKIPKVREESQRKSLQGLDNTAAAIGLVWKTRHQLAHLNSYLT